MYLLLQDDVSPNRNEIQIYHQPRDFFHVPINSIFGSPGVVSFFVIKSKTGSLLKSKGLESGTRIGEGPNVNFEKWTKSRAW